MTQLEQISLGVARTRLGGVTVVSDAPIRARRLSSGHVDRQPFGRIVSEMIRAIKIVGDEKVPRNTPRTSLLPFTMYTHSFHLFWPRIIPPTCPLTFFIVALRPFEKVCECIITKRMTSKKNIYHVSIILLTKNCIRTYIFLKI